MAVPPDGRKELSPSMTFPKNFAWGAATSAYQIEGGWKPTARGRATGMHSAMRRVPAGSVGNIPGQVYSPGNVFMNHTGDVACDHYNRGAEMSPSCGRSG